MKQGQAQTEGLILLTNDEQIARKPSHQLQFETAQIDCLHPLQQAAI